MKKQSNLQNIVLAPAKVIPLGWVLKFDPPVIGLLYKRNMKETKKHLYQIHLNNLIFLTSGEDITRQIFYEHPNYLNPNFVKPDQVQKPTISKVLNLVMKLLDYKNQKLREMAQFMEEYDEGEQPLEEEYDQDDQNMEFDNDEIDYEKLTEDQLFQLYQQQMQQQEALKKGGKNQEINISEDQLYQLYQQQMQQQQINRKNLFPAQRGSSELNRSF